MASADHLAGLQAAAWEGGAQTGPSGLPELRSQRRGVVKAGRISEAECQGGERGSESCRGTGGGASLAGQWVRVVSP